MIQFNLLPDVKLQYLKAQRVKRLIVFISIIVGAAALAVLLLLVVTVDIVQKKSLSDASNDVTTYSAKLKSIPNLNDMLTVQNQLNTLTSLHDQKPVTTRMFGYISQLTPPQVTISTLATDFVANTMSITGEAPSLEVVNAFTDTLKSTAYTVDGSSTHPKPAFSAVVLSNFGRDSRSATYTITFSFDPVIFNSANSVSLNVPNVISGPQQILFQKQAGS